MWTPRHGTPFDARRRRVQNALVALVSLVGLLAGASLLIAVLPRTAAEERAFLSASPCRNGAREDCLRVTWFFVDSIRVRHGKSSGGEMRLSTSEQGYRTVKFSGIGDFLERTRTGDRVVGTEWRGSIVLVSDAEGGQRTDAHPVGGSLFAAGFGIVLVLAGGYGTVVARRWIRHSDDAPAGRRSPSAVVTGAVILCGLYTFALTAALYERDASLRTFFSLWVPAAFAAVAAVLWQRLRSRRRSDGSIRHRSG
ncbi:hypothetical protein AB0M64_03760 [Streptomyces sp. NPDC051771]|uniref:hypothetical protein n=1 Tax=Streptomyces sp. NPDC051771 TaxID=3154847 RepID=UPI00343C8950